MVEISDRNSPLNLLVYNRVHELQRFLSSQCSQKNRDEAGQHNQQEHLGHAARDFSLQSQVSLLLCIAAGLELPLMTAEVLG